MSMTLHLTKDELARADRQAGVWWDEHPRRLPHGTAIALFRSSALFQKWRLLFPDTPHDVFSPILRFEPN